MTPHDHWPSLGYHKEMYMYKWMYSRHLIKCQKRLILLYTITLKSWVTLDGRPRSHTWPRSRSRKSVFLGTEQLIDGWSDNVTRRREREEGLAWQKTVTTCFFLPMETTGRQIKIKRWRTNFPVSVFPHLHTTVYVMIAHHGQLVRRPARRHHFLPVACRRLSFVCRTTNHWLYLLVLFSITI